MKIDAETLNDLKAYLDLAHPSRREQDKPKTVGEWKQEGWQDARPRLRYIMDK